MKYDDEHHDNRYEDGVYCLTYDDYEAVGYGYSPDDILEEGEEPWDNQQD